MPAEHVPAGSTDGELIRTPSGVLVPAVIDPFHRALRHVAPAGLVAQTTQTVGMRRLEAISGKTVGARNLWMGETHVPASTASANHHHGTSETAIYVVAGHPVFVFLDVDGDSPVETRIETGPGDYVFVPPFVPHREENPEPESEAVVVIARTTQEAIVVNLDGLDWSQVDPSVPGQAGPADC
jgi:uncharacterized RmlC-like cupin family protein